MRRPATCPCTPFAVARVEWHWLPRTWVAINRCWYEVPAPVWGGERVYAGDLDSKTHLLARCPRSLPSTDTSKKNGPRLRSLLQSLQSEAWGGWGWLGGFRARLVAVSRRGGKPAAV